MDGPMTPAIVLEAPITFEVTGDRIANPMVRASVAGIQTLFILDTGASDHVFTIELAERARLSLHPGEPGTDHTGAQVQSWSAGDLELDIDGARLELRGVVAIEGPAPFERWGIGGFLSPQRLHGSAYAVLDLIDDRLMLVDADPHTVPVWLSGRHRSMRSMVVPRASGEAIVIEASIEPHPPVRAILDTGSAGTDFARAAVPGLTGARAGAGFGVGGTQAVGASVTDQTLRVGEARLPIPVLTVRDHIEAHDAMVGMDVLGGTVLAVCAEHDRPVIWLVPQP